MVKKLFTRLAGGKPAPAAGAEGFDAEPPAEPGDTPPPLVPWVKRGEQVGAKLVDRAQGEAMFARVWATDRHATAIGEHGLRRLTEYLDFVQIGAERDVINQDEQGDFLLIVLDGVLAVDRMHPWGGRTRLGEARAGDMLGEMSLIDAGTRFSACRTLKPCVVAVLEAQALERMMRDDARLAAALLAALARRLSLRLRQASARLGALLAAD